MMYLPTLPELFARPWGKTLDLEFRRMRTDSRSEEHTSELQSQSNLVCRLLLEKKKLRGFIVRHAHPAQDVVGDLLSHFHVPVETNAVRCHPERHCPSNIVQETAQGTRSLVTLSLQATRHPDKIQNRLAFWT